MELRENKISISPGNSKLGKLPNFSLAPGKTCSPAACATCFNDGCYARKSYRLYPQTKDAWDRNTEFAKKNVSELKDRLTEYFKRNKPRFFRIHVGGDFVAPDYSWMWTDVIGNASKTQFLFFTKQYEMAKPIDWPRNVSPVFSAWPGLEFDRDRFPVAWMDDGTETRIPDNAIKCPGDCEHCGMCFNLPDLKRDVVFHKH